MRMLTQIVLTLIGRDRPGMVDTLANTVADHGGNWLESRMCHLGGEFAGILRVELPPDREADLTAALAKLESSGLQVTVRQDKGAVAPAKVSATIEVMGQDRPGIVRQISKALAAQRVNVEELHTERVSAPMSGEMMFQATIAVQIPADSDGEALRRELERIATDLMVEIRLGQGE